MSRLLADLPPALAGKFVFGKLSCFRAGCLTDIEADGQDVDVIRELKEWSHSEEAVQKWNAPVLRGAPSERNGRLFFTWVFFAPNEDATSKERQN